MIDDEGETELISTPLLDGYIDSAGRQIKYRPDEASKGEFVIESTLREAGKYQSFSPGSTEDKVRVYQSLKTRVETFLFPPSGKTTWDQLKDHAASGGSMIWTPPNTLEQMRQALLTAGEWREEAGLILKPPFEEVTGVHVEYARNPDDGKIVTTDIKLSHADTLYCKEDGGEWKKVDPDSPCISEAMTIWFKAVDSKGKNKEGQPYKIENPIDIVHDFMDAAAAGAKVVKLKVVPPTCKVRFTIDGADPANSGTPYSQKGIEAPEGATVRIYAEKGPANKEMTIKVPFSDTETPDIDPTKPLTVKAKGIKPTTRAATHKFLRGLPEDAALQMVRAKVVLAATDSSATLTWDNKTRLTPDRVMKAFEFLDGEIADAEWQLVMSSLHFPNGKSFLEWQVATDTKIEPNLISQ